LLNKNFNAGVSLLTPAFLDANPYYMKE